MRSAGRVVIAPRAFRVERLRRARMGKAVSAVLRDARRLLEHRGWEPRYRRRSQSLSRGPVDVVTAVQIAARRSLTAKPELVDYYALLAPIASVVRSSFLAWESQVGLELSAVLTMMDAAILVAIEAERSAAARPSIARLASHESN